MLLEDPSGTPPLLSPSMIREELASTDTCRASSLWHWVPEHLISLVIVSGCDVNFRVLTRPCKKSLHLPAGTALCISQDNFLSVHAGGHASHHSPISGIHCLFVLKSSTIPRLTNLQIGHPIASGRFQ